MNLVAFGLILICCHAWAIEIDDNFPATWFDVRKTYSENFLERFKSSLQNGTNGLEVYGIQVYDPYIVNKLPIKYNISTPVGNIGVEGRFENLNVSGLASYNVNSAKFKLIGMKGHMDLSWPLIIASTNYSLKGNALNYDVYGDGNIDGATHNFRSIIDIGFNLKDRHVQVQSIATKLFLEALEFNVTGIYNDENISEIFSKTISDVIPKAIAENQDTIAYIINNIAKRILNKYLLTLTFSDLLKILGM